MPYGIAKRERSTPLPTPKFDVLEEIWTVYDPHYKVNIFFYGPQPAILRPKRFLMSWIFLRLT